MSAVEDGSLKNASFKQSNASDVDRPQRERNKTTALYV